MILPTRCWSGNSGLLPGDLQAGGHNTAQLQILGRRRWEDEVGKQAGIRHYFPEGRRNKAHNDRI